MSERYWITGVQLALLQVMQTEKERKELIEKFGVKQFIGDYPTDDDKELFKKKIASLFKETVKQNKDFVQKS